MTGDSFDKKIEGATAAKYSYEIPDDNKHEFICLVKGIQNDKVVVSNSIRRYVVNPYENSSFDIDIDGPDSVCVRDEVTLTASVTEGYTYKYEWYNNGVEGLDENLVREESSDKGILQKR